MRSTEVTRRRNLPHWDVPGATYFVTSCLDGSIPARGLLDIERYRSELSSRPKPAHMTESEWDVHRWKLGFARAERWLDFDPPVRHLADETIAGLVVDAFYFFAGERYDLLAYVVMPSHTHWVFRPRESWVKTLSDEAEGRLEAGHHKIRTPRERIVHSVNSYTATRANRILGASGAFWQHESYDHWARSTEELERIMLYVEANPVTAGLTATAEGWKFSSARQRKIAGKELGEPLVR